MNEKYGYDRTYYNNFWIYPAEIKDIKNPTDKELEIVIKEVQNDEIKMCNCCKYNNDCIGSVVCYGNEPVFPPCADIEYKELFDYEKYVDMISNE